MTTYFDFDKGSVFIQLAGLNSITQWLPCVDMGDVDSPQGDVNREYCPDPTKKGSWITAIRTQGAPGEVTYDFTIYKGPTASLLDQMAARRCPVSFYVLQSDCGPRDSFLPLAADIEYSGTVYKSGLLTSKGESNAVMRNADGGAPTGTTRTFSISAEEDQDFYALTPTRRTTVAAGVTNDVVFWTRENCQGACGPFDSLCSDGCVVEANIGAAIANLYFTADSGVTWTVSAALPFAVSEEISSVVAVWMNAATVRVIVSRGTTDGANEGEIAYSDDLGVTWTLVEYGTTDGEFVPWNGGLFALDKEHIWLVTDTGAGAAGNIFFSNDGGATWTLQTATGDAFNAIHFVNTDVGLAVGDTNDMFKTKDGGVHWDAVTGPAAQAAADALSCLCLDTQRFFVGYDDGEVWYSQDGGATWAQRVIPVPDGNTSVDAINAMYRIDDHCWWMASAGTGGTEGAIHRTVDGGYSWESWVPPAAADLSSVHACDWNHAIGVGAIAVTSMILDVGTL